MYFRISAFALTLSLIASSAFAEMIVINGRYVVPKEDVRGYFYREQGVRTVFDIRWSEWSTQYRCQDEYDRARVQAASLNFVLQMAEASSMDFQEFLDGEEFEGCEKF